MVESNKRCHKGPPNRMNDLAYKDWMKFQKSFFRYNDIQSLINEFVQFFTKSVWEDGNPSTSIVGDPESSYSISSSEKRQIVVLNKYHNSQEVLQRIENCGNSGQHYDFAIIDLRTIIQSIDDVEFFLENYKDKFFSALRSKLLDNRYCCLILRDKPSGNESTFPIAWSIALSSRKHFRLRDEKIGIVGPQEVFYCIILQAAQDSRPEIMITPKEFLCSAVHPQISTWTIPKPPPRKKHEILHPAKYPETLVSEFIKIFSNPGDTIFDPMVGTGSTVIAAIEQDRNAIGMDLSKEFITIAKRRLQDVQTLKLFPEMENHNHVEFIEGDANNILEIKSLARKHFDYVITSPPYWSMLTNPGSENQKLRRNKNLQLTYSNKEDDIGNVKNYDQFLKSLSQIYIAVATKMSDKSFLTVVLKNVKREHILYTLPWDLAVRLCSNDGPFIYRGTTLWCQDDISLKPFAVGIHWVSNILHHYCIHMEKK